MALKIVWSAACMVLFCSWAMALESGELIHCGTRDGRGPLATHAVLSEPVGTARLSGADEPDLFVQTNRYGLRPGLFLYEFAGRAKSGAPVFRNAKSVGFPFNELHPPAGCIFQTADGAVHALWLQGKAAVHAVLNTDDLKFEERGRIAFDGLPRGAGRIGAVMRDGGAMTLLLQVSDGVAASPEGDGRDADYRPYDGRGIWRGGLPYVCLYAVDLPQGLSGPVEPARLATPTEREARSQYAGITPVDFGQEGSGILTGSHFGSFYYYKNDEPTGLKLAAYRYAVGEDGIALRHPSIHPAPLAYGDGFVAGGEGGVYWYRFTGRLTAGGNPIYDAPVPALEDSAALFGGSLPVPTVADWDGDGDQDMIAGNSEGFILFFENRGDNKQPEFLPGVELEAGGHTIQIQPGYAGDIQGPGEARWGYVCPTVVDWDQDGDLDIVTSDSTAKHTVFINEGTAKRPRLAAGGAIYYDGLDLFGTWRVRPAAGLMAGRMAYVALDDDDAFHLYWQQDARNVTDGGKLCLDTGEVIQANYLNAGGTGRLKLELVDWDRDGVKDLLVGTPRHASVPDPKRGLPQSLGKPGSAILFLKNTGTEAAPRFAFPQLFAFKGKPIYLGQHACGPTAADFGKPGGPDLISAEESGRFFFYDRNDLTTISMPQHP